MKLSCHRRFGFLNLARVAQTGIQWGWGGRVCEIKEDSTVWYLKLWPLAVLTGDRINEGFYKRMYSRFNGPKNKVARRNNEVTVLPRWL